MPVINERNSFEIMSVLICKKCGDVLIKKIDNYHCNSCHSQYPIVNGIIDFKEDNKHIDLRIPKELLNIHEFITRRKFFDRIVESDVEYYGRLHSIEFVNLHHDHLKPYLKFSKIIDLGCGQIPYLNAFNENEVSEYYGVDLSRESLNIVKNSFTGLFPLILIRHNILNTPFANESCDIVISSEVIEHIDEPHLYLKEANRILKNGGYLSLSTPCVSMYFYPHNFYFAARHPKKFQKMVNPHKYWNEALKWHPGLRPKILRRWVEQEGFEIFKHQTILWYYATPIKLTWRIFSLLENFGVRNSGKVFYNYLKLLDNMLSLHIPVLKWLGIRQFVLAQKRYDAK